MFPINSNFTCSPGALIAIVALVCSVKGISTAQVHKRVQLQDIVEKYVYVESARRPKNVASAQRPSLYVCGWDVGFESWVSYVFSDFEQKGILRECHKRNFTQNDILVFGQRGPCPVQRDWILQNFQGKVAYVNGEGYGPHYATGRDYAFGNIGLKGNNHSFYFPYGFAVALWKHPERMVWICDPSQKVKGTKKNSDLH